jgi:GNAT superfamily N-acetyltransferase
VRIAEASDEEAITALVNLAFQVERFFVDGDRIDRNQVREFLGKGEFLLAESGGRLAGCVYIEPRAERAYLGLLSVDPSLQSAGIGRRLMSAAEARCREKGARFMDLNIVNLREELPAFYRRQGYVELGTAPFPAMVATKLPCHFIRMSKPLGESEPVS